MKVKIISQSLDRHGKLFLTKQNIQKSKLLNILLKRDQFVLIDN